MSRKGVLSGSAVLYEPDGDNADDIWRIRFGMCIVPLLLLEDMWVSRMFCLSVWPMIKKVGFHLENLVQRQV
jgi:hypothetical protein